MWIWPRFWGSTDRHNVLKWRDASLSSKKGDINRKTSGTSPYVAALRLGTRFLSQHLGWKPYGLTFFGRVENLDPTDPLKVATPLAQALCKAMKTYDPEVTTYNQTEFWQKMKSFAPEVQHLIMLKSTGAPNGDVNMQTNGDYEVLKHSFPMLAS